ncbi:hypothetical protein GGD56_003205 [Rhizobium mongolense]|uniref:Uncharacterized protein n=2 Tax=Rhizobium mongolense TaxID=57676 RepID=A0ABR6IPA6_9HYPH|nr:hypothetical protein [Rhizobium mongolense]TVZ73467.1 hypothetical protein BCL32_1697 [Rhizobium mongolense USDA 1844]
MARREFTGTGTGKRSVPSNKNLRSLAASRRKAKGEDDDSDNALRQRQ